MGGAVNNIGESAKTFFGQSMEYDPVSGKTVQKGSGLLGWASKNPDIFTGLMTGILGSTQGLGGLESAGLGGQMGGAIRGEQQRQLEFGRELENRMAIAGLGNQLNITNKGMDDYVKEANALGIKDPQEIQEYAANKLLGIPAQVTRSNWLQRTMGAPKYDVRGIK